MKIPIALAAIFITGFLVRINYDEDIPDPVFLSRDLFFQIGEDVISVPAVAVSNVSIPPDNTNPLPRYRFNSIFISRQRLNANNEFKTAMIKFAADPDMPAKVSRISLYITAYETYGEYGISQKICPLLTKNWSRRVCKNEFPPALKDLPRGFSLTSEGGLEPDQRKSFSDVPEDDLSKDTGALSAQIKMTCTDKQKFCKATLAISDDVYAVWSASCGQLTAERCKRANITKGNAIYHFVRNELMVK